MNGEVIQEEEEEFDMSADQLEARIISLLDTCTYTVYNYTRRGLFDRDKLIVLTLLTFQILLRGGKVDPQEYEALCKGARSPAPPLITDDLSRWMNEGQWAAVDALAAVPGEQGIGTRSP
jgi:dynein heavy chain